MSKNFIQFKKGFLVLKRKSGQGLRIGDDIEVILKEKDGVTYLCVSAPGLKVLRSEIFDKEPKEKGEKNE